MSEDKVQAEIVPPAFSDPTWSDFVIGQLTADEVIEGFPKTDGLRRLVEKYVGEIVEMNSSIVQAPNSGNNDRAVITVQICVRKQNGDISRFSGAADACTRNSDPPYNMYPTSIAETRAYGRAFRNALRIKTAVAEELSKNADYAAETADSELKISGPQIRGIEHQCKLLDMNVEHFVNSGEVKYSSIKQVPLNKATLMMRTLNQYQNGERKDIPDAYKGFVKDWRTTFLGD